jgi:transcriptional regulator with XRE-family HTH domain
MALGETLRNARVQKGLSPSEVAENTHMMVQVIEDLEREDFRRIAAPIYGRGFVRLYAELLELDPEPLIRDFMDLYAGARAPVVRTKRVESQAAPLPSPSESVAAPAAGDGALSSLPPQRQPVQPKPLVRPLSVPQPAVAVRSQERQEPSVQVEEDSAPALSARAAKESGGRSSEESLPTSALNGDILEAEDNRELVVEPEEAVSESDEPDLFKPQPPRRKPVAEAVVRGRTEKDEGEGTRPSGPKRKLPVFKIGGRMEERAPDAHDEAAHERRRARIQKFVDGFNSLKSGVESKLPAMLPHKQLVIIGSVGLVVLMCMAFGIRVLFKMTGSNVKDAPAMVIKPVAPPPDLYVD